MTWPPDIFRMWCAGELVVVLVPIFFYTNCNSIYRCHDFICIMHIGDWWVGWWFTHLVICRVVSLTFLVNGAILFQVIFSHMKHTTGSPFRFSNTPSWVWEIPGSTCPSVTKDTPSLLLLVRWEVVTCPFCSIERRYATTRSLGYSSRP